MVSRHHLFRIAPLCLVCIGVIASHEARAQGPDAVLADNPPIHRQHRFRVKLGVTVAAGSGYNLTSTDPAVGLYQDSTVAMRLSGGISYDLTPTRADHPWVYSLNADYFIGPDTSDIFLPFLSLLGKDTTTLTDTTAFGASARYIFGHSRRSFPYAEAGLGVYITHVQVNEFSNTSQQTTTRYSERQASPGGKIALGYQAHFGLFAEAEYHLVGAFQRNRLEYNPSSGRVSIGWRF